jgi:hypothetical protein
MLGPITKNVSITFILLFYTAMFLEMWFHVVLWISKDISEENDVSTLHFERRINRFLWNVPNYLPDQDITFQEFVILYSVPEHLKSHAMFCINLNV